MPISSSNHLYFNTMKFQSDNNYHLFASVSLKFQIMTCLDFIEIIAMQARFPHTKSSQRTSIVSWRTMGLSACRCCLQARLFTLGWWGNRDHSSFRFQIAALYLYLAVHNPACQPPLRSFFVFPCRIQSESVTVRNKSAKQSFWLK